jgi:hypothetical protein
MCLVAFAWIIRKAVDRAGAASEENAGEADHQRGFHGQNE